MTDPVTIDTIVGIDPTKFPGVVENASDERLGMEAREKALPAMQALSKDDLLKHNFDVALAVATILRFLSIILKFRQPAAEQCPKVDLGCFDNLETYVLAANHCEAALRAAVESKESVEEVGARCFETRDTFRSDFNALVKRSLLQAAWLKDYEGTVGYNAVSKDNLLLINILRNNWANIEGKCAVTKKELDDAERDAIHLQRLSGGGKTPPKTIEAATDERDRSVTLMIRSYDQVRRVISFLRWEEDDLETIAPGLSGGKKHRKEEKEPLKPVLPIPHMHLTNETNGTPTNHSAKVEPENPNMPTGSPFLKK